MSGEIKEVEDPSKIIQVQPSEPEVRLGSLAVRDDDDLVARATMLANKLAEVINNQQLYVIIKNKRGKKNKYVKAEGWLTLGAMMGIVPIEEYCHKLADGKGFEAKIRLIRAKDSGLVGAASAECTYNETNWSGRDSYSLRSMSLTRATGKAFRLSFGWIMKLAGFEPTPAEEMIGEREEEAKEAVEAEVERQLSEHQSKIQASTHEGNGKAPQNASQPATKPVLGAAPALFISWPRAQKGQSAFVTGLAAIKLYGLKPYIEREAKGVWLSGDQGFMVPAGQVTELKAMAESMKCLVHEQDMEKAK